MTAEMSVLSKMPWADRKTNQTVQQEADDNCKPIRKNQTQTLKFFGMLRENKIKKIRDIWQT